MDPQEPTVPKIPDDLQEVGTLASSPSLGRIVLMSLGVLGLGMAIAFGGYYLGQQSKTIPVARNVLSNTPLPSQPTSSSSAQEMTPSDAAKIKTVYLDKYFGYQITYPSIGWIFRRTYGPDIPKDAPTDILSGFDITYNVNVNGTLMTQATIVGNILDGHGYTDIEKWIGSYDLNYPKNATRLSIIFNGYSALKYTDLNNTEMATEYIYFLAGKYAYRLTYVERPVIRNATRDIVNSFHP